MTKPERTPFEAKDADLILRKILKDRDIPTFQVAMYGLLAFKELHLFIHKDLGRRDLYIELFQEMPDETKSMLCDLDDIALEFLEELRKLKERYAQDTKDISNPD